MTVVLSILPIYYFLIHPRYQLWMNPPANVLGLGIFLLLALTINLLTANCIQSIQKLQQLIRQLAQENAKQLRMALSASQMGMWDWNIVTGVLNWSPEHEQLFGLTPGTFDGKYETFDALIHPEDRQALNQVLQQAVQTHSTYQHEYRVVWADGSIHWLEERGHAFYNEAGQPVRMTGTVMAIDERKQAQAALQYQFEQQRLVMEMTQRIRGTLNLEEILETTVDEVRQFLQCDRVIIFQFSPGWGGTVVVESVVDSCLAILPLAIYDPCIGEENVAPFKQGLVTAKADIYHAGISPCHVEFLASLQVRANLVVPILKGDELWGLLTAHHCTDTREWQASEIQLLRQLAAQASIAIQQAALFAQVQTELAERQKIAASLRQSEQRYRSLVNASAQIVWRTDAHGMAIIAPEGWEELTGQPAAAHLGLGWLDTVHPEDRDQTVQRWRESYTNGTLYETENRLRMKDGNYRYFAVRGVPILDEDGNIREFIGTCTDITERKQAEVTLRENQIQLQRQLAEIETIYQSAPIGLSVLDTDLRFVRINQLLAQMNGFSVSAHIGRTVRELLPDLADTAEPLLRLILETGKPLLNVELCGETPAQPGVQRTWLESFLPLKDDDRIIGISTVCKEITERKQAEEELKQAKEELEIRVKERTAQLTQANASLRERVIQQQHDITAKKQAESALRQSEERFRQLAENIHAVFLMIDVETRQVLYVSNAYEIIWQRSCHRLYQNWSTWLDAIHPDDRQGVEMAFIELLETGKYDIEYRIIRPDGSIRWIRDRAFPIKNEAGVVVRVAGIAEDITERHQIEQMKSEFIGIVSHELRTPLTAIRAALGLLNTGIYDKKPEKFKRMIEIASTDSDRLVRLVNDILDLERLESGRVVLQKKTCPAADLIQQAIEGVRVIANQQHITLKMHPSDAQVWAAGDAIIQALTNLLSNAIKFSPADSTITLSVQQQPDCVLFQISDQGRGIPPDKLEAIFVRFQQVDASDSRDKSGTGLGLAICRSIIDQHGGKIWAQSTVGMGSTFFFTLPLPPEEQLN
ncbi:MAG: PAS domain-containing protein [Stigonema ocellatum SAG 48.90 = DSM 106950]|nr:PAS domain-containing protein [Stigonema ocellatum SAG 48.90 = DSM 106950]